ncbi:TerB family tellurite resistance protein [Hoeflea ulvae]|uniref:TerB family tellurite resistance protein n=1 Tax=Hoeflea ulvae TaxID=2983764 RepID=A0ABT3YJ10_9HYPH|nr:TerB family tellurite resistance protein [Hoeflea ulvae]MCY0095893.1 TerB family tellurite resistance protein [Hoeflea ulvae]
MFEPKPEWTGALGKLAENPVALAEVLVLFRMVLADGVVHPSQLTAFERICERQFGISPRDMPELHALLDSPRARLVDAEAFTLLSQLDTEARTALLDDMMRIARAHSDVGTGEDRLIRRTAGLLGLEFEARLGAKEE